MTLNEVSELSWRQLYPNPSDETAVTLEEFERTAFAEYSYQSLMLYWKILREEAYYEIPFYLLNTAEIEVIDNKADISKLRIFKAFPGLYWLQQVGGICECEYVKSDINRTSLLCDDDSLPDSARTFYAVGNNLIFPQGTHSNKLPITYISWGGENVDGDLEIDPAVGALVRTRLIEIYGGNRTGVEDTTNNTSSTT